MGLVSTKVDGLANELKKKGSLGLAKLSSTLDWEDAALEKAARTLERVGILRIDYPISITQRPEISLAKELLTKPRQSKPAGKQIDSYEFNVDEKLKIPVSIILSDAAGGHLYYADIPWTSPYTDILLQNAKDEAAKALPPEPLTASEEAKAAYAKKRREIVFDALQSVFGSKEKSLDLLCGIIMREMFGIGEIENLMYDDSIEEIALNKSQLPAFVYHRKHGWLKTNLVFEDEDKLYNLASLVGRKVGKQVSSLFPILDAHLASGDRVNATIFPISSLGNAITIRKFARNPITILDFVGKAKNLSYDMAAFLWQAIHYERSIIVCGGTASGKTTMLNALITVVPPSQRIITIEDTRELMLPSTLDNWVALRTRTKNPEGLGEVTMLDLLVNSLRMRPDRIVMGEIRKKEEAEVLFEAMHTGHSTYGTVHADTADMLVERLIEPPFSLPNLQVSSLDLAVVQYRDRRSGSRRTLEISEIYSGDSKPELRNIYFHKPRNDTFEFANKPKKYLSLLELHTGMTEKEIAEDLEGKKQVLKWASENSLNSVENVGKVMKEYYKDGSTLVEMARKGTNPSKVF